MEETAMRHRKLPSACVLPAAAIGLALLSAPVRAETDEKGFVRTRPEQVDLAKGTATVEGDPAKPGIYVLRIKFEPHHFSMPHWHNTDRHIVVLKGTWYMGVGEKFDPATAVPMPVGSYIKHPAGAIHWDGAMDEEVVLQIIGEGPVTTDLVNKDGPLFTTVK
jgi:quercetin dioxygenase-like cupin family protein